MQTLASLDPGQIDRILRSANATHAATQNAGRVFCEWETHRLHSCFQPIVSFSHRAVVGHEGLVRAHDAAGTPISPPTLLRQASDAGALISLDRMCRYLHLTQAAALKLSGYLFLNMHPLAFAHLDATDGGSDLRDLLAQCGVPADRIVIEITEDVLQDDSTFESSVNYLRRIGCQIALDDFGAGHSNFDRVWRLRPEIVKLDRDFAVRAEQSEDAHRLLPQIVELLHEAGSLVLLEGIETAEQARIAMSADVDFAQGYYFGRPQPDAAGESQAVAAIDAVWASYDAAQADHRGHFRQSVAAYVNAIGHAAAVLADRRPIDQAIEMFLGLDGAMRCYLLDDKGFQMSRNLALRGKAAPSGFRPEVDSARSRWSHRPYFRRALESPGRVCITRPYLCISSAILCLTVSFSFRIDGQLRVLCGDVAWA
jgi:EAL domain-containing protein (putative c-di-GMP-specific phosphodiesterase class I)